MGNSGKGEREPGSAPSGGDLATLCDQQAGGGSQSLPVQGIEQVVRPNTQQRNALADLKRTSRDTRLAISRDPAQLKYRKHRWHCSMQSQLG